MKKTTLGLALRLAQLLEEYSEAEMRSAVRLLQVHGARSELFSLLSGDDKKALSSQHAPHVGSRPRQAVKKSKALLELEATEPDKARLVAAFEDALRQGEVLRSFEDMKRFAGKLSKNISMRKSRNESISALTSALAQRDIEDIRSAIQAATSFDDAASGESFQRLAHYLIKGRT